MSMLSGLLGGKRSSTNSGAGATSPSSSSSTNPKSPPAKGAKKEDPTKKRKVYKQGLLKKQGGSQGGWKTWNERWFVFHSDGVSYYKDEPSYIRGDQELGFLQLDTNLAFKNQDEASERYFRIVSSGRTIVVKAKTMDIKRDWLAIITKIKDETSSLDHLLTEVSKGGTIEGKVNHKPMLAPPSEPRETERKVEIKMLSNSLKEGKMKKAGGQVQTWKARYFVLMPNSLDYYKDETARKKKGTIPFTKDTTVTIINLPHTFCVTPSPGGRKYVIEANCDEERDSWMTAMHSLPDIRFTVLFPEKKDSATATEVHERILEDILYIRGDDAKAKHEDFLNFSRSIFSEENVLFWLDVQKFKATEDPIEQSRLADSINTKYLTAGSEFEVSAAPEMKSKLSMDIEGKRVEKGMFDPIQRACLAQILADVMPKYMSRSLGDIADATKAAIEREEQEKRVEIVPLEQLCNTLTSVKSVENVFFRRAFLLYHRAFMTSDELWTRLETAYTESDSGEQKLAIASKLHIVSVLQEWVRHTKYLDLGPIYPRASRSLRNFREAASLAMAEDTKETEKGPFLLASELQALVCMIEEAKDDHETKMRIDSTASGDGDGPGDVREDICDYTPQAVAECLTREYHGMFKCLQYREFYDKAWTRKEIASTTSPNILKLIDVFNAVGNWVASEILNREDPKVRCQTIAHFILICWELKKIHNFFGLFAIWAGLNMMPVIRLKKAWAALPTSVKEMVEHLKHLTDQGYNYRAYRKLFKLGLGRPQIPHMLVILKDCFLFEELSTLEKATGNINFGKFMRQYRELVDIFQCMRYEYPYPQDTTLTAVLKSCQKSFILTTDKMWQRSYRFEPKATDA